MSSIRKATAADLETLIDFAVREAEETEGNEPDPEGVRRGVGRGLDGVAPVAYWVAETEAGEVIGGISVVTEWSNLRGGDYWWVQSLYVVPEYRGSGLVDRLLDEVAEQAKQAGALDLRLYVLESNGRARAAYRRCGFGDSVYLIMNRQLD